MKIVRFLHNDTVKYGIFEGGMYNVIGGSIFSDFSKTGESVDPNHTELLYPVDPPNIIAIGANYRKHVLEFGGALPERPLIFIKLTTSLLSPEKPIELPRRAPSEVDYEGELAVIIGRKCKDVPPERAHEYIFGYTCANDISARDCQQRIDSQWARAKSFDTFCPLGPWIETELDPKEAGIMTRLNGKTMQNSNTSDLIFDVPHLVSYCSSNFTLLPGTVILTGTPEGVGGARDPQVFLRENDVVEVEIEGIGILRNNVVIE